MPVSQQKSKSYPKSPADENHKLLRVRVHKKIFERMQTIAKDQSDVFCEHISISDIVRASIHSFIQVQESKERLERHINQRKNQK